MYLSTRRFHTPQLSREHRSRHQIGKVYIISPQAMNLSASYPEGSTQRKLYHSSPAIGTQPQLLPLVHLSPGLEATSAPEIAGFISCELVWKLYPPLLYYRSSRCDHRSDRSPRRVLEVIARPLTSISSFIIDRSYHVTTTLRS